MTVKLENPRPRLATGDPTNPETEAPAAKTWRVKGL